MSIHERLPQATDLAEVILYAVPNGDLELACREYWQRVDAAGRSTVAQTYPPHCTLTGFFRRPQARLEQVVADMRWAIPEPSVASDDVAYRLQVSDEWVGLAIDAPAFAEVIDGFVHTHRVDAGEDDLRPKSWMHLSLAYGDGLDVDWHGALARDLFGDATSSPWTVGLWRRHADGRWEELRPTA